VDGTEQTQITTNPTDDIEPVWSPDGTKISFASNRDGNLEIYIMNANGTEQNRITTNPPNDTRPAWSPNGSKIAFESAQNVPYIYYIYIVNPDGTGLSQLTSANDIEPAWSPDGSKIAFCSWRDGIPQIYIMNNNGTEQTRMTFSYPSWDSGPAWNISE
jgi:TolB protein